MVGDGTLLTSHGRVTGWFTVMLIDGEMVGSIVGGTEVKAEIKLYENRNP